jgi:hypothetical protein
VDRLSESIRGHSRHDRICDRDDLRWSRFAVDCGELPEIFPFTNVAQEYLSSVDHPHGANASVRHDGECIAVSLLVEKKLSGSNPAPHPAGVGPGDVLIAQPQKERRAIQRVDGLDRRRSHALRRSCPTTGLLLLTRSALGKELRDP